MLPTFEALRIAQERGLDLVEVAPTAIPPVCRLMDYGRFKYEQTKKEREARKNQKVVELKEVRLTPRTDEHDILAKVKTITRFLDEGDKVKVTIRFRGRELAHPQLGRQVLEEVHRQLANTAVVERPPLMEGRAMFMILSPPGARGGPGAPPAPRPDGQAAAARPPLPAGQVSPRPAAASGAPGHTGRPPITPQRPVPAGAAPAVPRPPAPSGGPPRPAGAPAPQRTPGQ